MRRDKLTVAIVCAIFLIGAGQSEAIVFFQALGGKNIGTTSYWPEGLKEAVLAHPPVAGQEMDAPTWGEGMINADLCFVGDLAAFNAFLKGFSAVKHDKLVLLLHPGKGAFSGGPRKLIEPVLFNWQLSVSTGGTLRRVEEKDPPIVHVRLNYYLGEDGNLMGLALPANVDVAAGYDEKYRQTHEEDFAVRAIDSFVQQRQKQE